MRQANRRDLILASGALLTSTVLADSVLSSSSIAPGLEAETLRQVAQRRGIKIGAAVSSHQVLTDAGFRSLLLRNCALLVPEWEMKWKTVRRSRGLPDFTGVDRLATFARSNGLALRGHTLVWHAGIPDWILHKLRDGYAEEIMKEHIDLLMRRYSSSVYSWDVVNEAVLPQHGLDRGLRKSPWLDAIGPSYIAKSFLLANEMAPNARLVYNDYNIEYEPKKGEAVLGLIKKMKDDGVPVHGVGLQSHLWSSRRKPDLDYLKRFCRDIAREGLEILITELDVRENDFSLDQNIRDEIVAGVVDRYLEAVFTEIIPSEISFWGLSDRYSWLNMPKSNPENPMGNINRGLLYDQDLRPKKILYKVMDRINSLPMVR